MQKNAEGQKLIYNVVNQYFNRGEASLKDALPKNIVNNDKILLTTRGDKKFLLKIKMRDFASQMQNFRLTSSFSF